MAGESSEHECAMRVKDVMTRLLGIVTISDLRDLLGDGAARPVPRSRRRTARNRGQKRCGSVAGACAK